jgi:hypothetical protein
MELVVKPQTIEVVLKARTLGALQRCNWVFDASQTHFEVSNAVAPRIVSWAGILPRDWIVLTTTEAGEPKALLLLREAQWTRSGLR